MLQVLSSVTSIATDYDVVVRLEHVDDGPYPEIRISGLQFFWMRYMTGYVKEREGGGKQQAEKSNSNIGFVPRLRHGRTTCGLEFNLLCWKKWSAASHDAIWDRFRPERLQHPNC